MFFGCVCSSLFKSILLGTYCYWELVLGFFCVAISLRAFSCQLASVVDFCGVVYLCISLFRNILFFFLFFFWRKYIYCFLGSFSWEIWVDRIYGWCGLVFPIYIFCSCSFLIFRYVVFYFSAMPINPCDSENVYLKLHCFLNNQICRLWVLLQRDFDR